MNGFTRYVLRQLCIGMLLVTGVLACIIWLSQSLRFVEMIVNQGATPGTFLYLTLLMLPNFLPMILPIALFLVVIFVYSKMVSDRELVVMGAAGQSQLYLAKPALLLTVIVVILGYVLNLHFVPLSYKMFRELKWEIRSYSHLVLKEGAFTNVSNVTVYVRERTNDGQLLGVLAYDKRNPEKPETWMAAKGALVETPTGARVVMFDGNRQTVDKRTNKFSILYFDQGTLDLKDLAGGGPGAPARHREARERSLGELLDLENAEGVSPQDFGKYTVEAHKRIVSPLRALSFTLIALCFLILGSFSRRSQAQKITYASLVAVALLILSLGLENIAAKRLHFVPLMYVNAILPILFAGLVLVRPPHRSRPAKHHAY